MTTRDRLSRRLGPGWALVTGLGAMLGAGVFGAVGPAAGSAGSALLLALVLAGAVAACNAASSARLAARYPESGGAYAYAGRRLGPPYGFAAGWAFTAGKLASCAAMALVLGNHVWPEHPRVPALVAIAACTAVNHMGITKTAGATAAVLALVAAGLVAAVVGALAGGQADPGRIADAWTATPGGVLEAAGFLFFAFAGYARLATLGEEVRDPERTIPRAIALSVAIAFAVYAVVMTAALMAVRPEVLAASPRPLVAAVNAGSLDALAPVVSAAAAVASLGVLLSLLAGVSRTVFAMARKGDMPRPLRTVHRRRRVPHVAGLAAGVAVAAVVAVADVRGAIGFSSVLVLVYYALANASALGLPAGRLGVPRALAVAGLLGCLLVAAALPPSSVLAAAGIMMLGFAGWVLRPVRVPR
ncbi:MAG: APC family permease [Thermoleophilia bacterium]